jgi:hypothetical protein
MYNSQGNTLNAPFPSTTQRSNYSSVPNYGNNNRNVATVNIPGVDTSAQGRMSKITLPPQAYDDNAQELSAGGRYQQGWKKCGDECLPVSGALTNSTQLAHFSGKSYEEIKAYCLKTRTLYEDPDFSADNRSLFPVQPPPELPRNTIWKRPPVKE